MSCSTNDSLFVESIREKNLKDLKKIESEYVLVNSLFGEMESHVYD